MTMTTTTNAHTYLDDVAPELVRILANPESDGERLILADFLEERGGHGDREQADFIRVELQLDDLDKNHFDHVLRHWDSEDSVRLCAELVPKAWNYLNWLCVEDYSGPLGLPNHETMYVITNGLSIPAMDMGLIFRRGFIAEIHAPLATLQQHLPALVRCHPIERVRATDKEPEFFKDLSNPWTWWRHGYRESSIGFDLWAKLDGYVSAVDSVSSGKDYPTAEAAHDALSRALLAWAKAQPIKEQE